MGVPRKEIFYAGESWGPEEPEDEDFPSNYLDVHFLSEDEGWLDFDQDYYDQPAEDYGEAVEVYDVDEQDDVCSAYVDAKNKMNQMRTARGFFPVVAMIGGGGGSHGKKDAARAVERSSRADPKGQGQEEERASRCRSQGRAHLLERPVDVLLLGNNCAFDVANQDTGHGTVLRVATARSGSGLMTMPRISTWSRTWMPRCTAWMSGAGALLGSRHQVKKYIKYLYPCTKGISLWQ